MRATCVQRIPETAPRPVNRCRLLMRHTQSKLARSGEVGSNRHCGQVSRSQRLDTAAGQLAGPYDKSHQDSAASARHRGDVRQVVVSGCKPGKRHLTRRRRLPVVQPQVSLEVGHMRVPRRRPPARPRGAAVIDGRGKFLMAGLWDMPVHPGWARERVSNACRQRRDGRMRS